jgi:hypothetical protein
MIFCRRSEAYAVVHGDRDPIVKLSVVDQHKASLRTLKLR